MADKKSGANQWKGFSRYQSAGPAKGGMNDAKALLDSLMGPSRNMAAKDKTGDEFTKREVCKAHLVGYCTGDWFQNTRARQSLGWKDGQHMPCTKIHSDQMKEEFENHPKMKQYRREYRREFLKQLESLAHDADARLNRERVKVRPPGKTLVIPELLKPKYEEQEKLYGDLMKLAEENGNNGKVAESEATMRKADEVSQWLDEMKKMNTMDFPGEEVCEVCGARYSKGPTVNPNQPVSPDEKLGKALVFEHFEGKIHKGFAQIRADIDNVKKEMSADNEDLPPLSRSRSRGKRRNRSRDRKSTEDEEDDFAFIFEGREESQRKRPRH